MTTRKKKNQKKKFHLKKKLHRKKKKATKKKKKKDPNAPKKPATAYMFYSKEQRLVLQEKHKGIKFGDLSKKISASWKELTDEDKKPYVKQHEEDKDRYNNEMENYQEPSASESSSDSDQSSEEEEKKKKKPAKKKQKKEKDPDQPKPKTNAYMYFQKDQREIIKKENPGLKSVPEIAKKIGAIWRSMSEDEKKPYVDQAEKDKERYDREMEEFKKKKEKS
eukprot:TRINITY_DN379_c0_g1_i8.p1 TRINITY_DN379_c0_g1~~TRINITY_DN379_c0_g1_i8.p1  ORF type:complete len:221 (-),score=64.06 TRINITY_DN379_c0_g1_i8:257-919(-)